MQYGATDELKTYCSQVGYDGMFQCNTETGRHILHQLCEDFRYKDAEFQKDLFYEALMVTKKFIPGGLNIRTTKTRPVRATVLSMACKQKWACKGCQPGDQIKAIETLLEYGADSAACSDRGDTILMEIAGAGNVPLFTYFFQRMTRENLVYCDLYKENLDGRNLYSISGCADEASRIHRDCNQEIKMMVFELCRRGLMENVGLTTRSGAHQGKKKPKRDDEGAAAQRGEKRTRRSAVKATAT